MTITTLYATKDRLGVDQDTSRNVLLEYDISGEITLRVTLDHWNQQPISLHKRLSVEELLELSTALKNAAKMRGVT